MPRISTGEVKDSPNNRCAGRTSFCKTGTNASAFSVGFGCVRLGCRGLRGNYLKFSVDLNIQNVCYFIN